MLAPVLEEVSEEYAGKVNFFNVDVDENPDLAMQYKIMNIPALVVLKKGEKVDTQVGFAPKENIVEFIKKTVIIKESGAYHSKGNRMTIWKNTMH